MKNSSILNRRSFNQLLATGALLSPLYGFKVPPPKLGSKMKMGLVTYLWGKDWDLPTLITNCAKAKTFGVELRIEHAHAVTLDLSKNQRLEVKKQFTDSRVTCLGMGTNQAYHYTDTTRLNAEIEGTKAFIKLSHDIGGTGVKVKPNAFPKGVSKEKTIEQIGKALNEVGKFGADYGQAIRVEVHGRGTQELPNLKAIMDVADHPNVKVCWNCNDQDLIGEGLESNFNLVKDRFGDTVHIREVNVGAYPYATLAKLFTAIDYEGWILLECRTNPANKVAAMKEQRKLWNKMVKQARRELKG
ncbi:MAG: sugar phosphate isomerase/epimerase [Saprospiraceae bacterium]|nr:sugar phosphate isomerase/epimerase [Saprospiraceae bacterium]